MITASPRGSTFTRSSKIIVVFVCDCNAREMRKIAALGVEDVEKEYAFANGIVDGLPVENVNCEGCVLFGNGECSRLCALTHRVFTY